MHQDRPYLVDDRLAYPSSRSTRKIGPSRWSPILLEKLPLPKRLGSLGEKEAKESWRGSQLSLGGFPKG